MVLDIDAQSVRIVSFDVIDERVRQHMKWGTQRHSWPEWITILTEEVGEAAQQACAIHWNHANTERLREELVQVAAVAVAIIEHIDEEQEHASQ